MKILTNLGLAAIVLSALSAPVLAADVAQDAGFNTALTFDITPDGDEFDRRGRGRTKPRVPGGSGCDDPRDLIEHPECRA